MNEKEMLNSSLLDSDFMEKAAEGTLTIPDEYIIQKVEKKPIKLGPYLLKIIKRNVILSRKYILLLIIPLILNMVFVVIPYGIEENNIKKGYIYTFMGVFLMYYNWSYFIWITLYDFVLPGCPWYFSVVFGFLHFIAQFTCLALIFTQGWLNKSFFLINGVIESVGSFVQYVFYALYIGIQYAHCRLTNKCEVTKANAKQAAAAALNLKDGDYIVDDAEEESLIDDVEEVEEEEYKKYESDDAIDHLVFPDEEESSSIISKITKKPKGHRLSHYIPNVVLNALSTTNSRDIQKKYFMYDNDFESWSDPIIRVVCYPFTLSWDLKKNQENIDYSDKSCWKSPSNILKKLVGLLCFKFSILVVWSLLQFFSTIWRDSTSGKRPLLLIFFYIARFVSPKIMYMITLVALPLRDVLPIRLICNFFTTMFFLMFYRSFVMDLQYKDLFQLFILNFITDALVYVVPMIKPLYRFQSKIKIKLMHLFQFPKYFPKIYRNQIEAIPYHKNVEDLSNDFFIKALSNYWTLAFFIVNGCIIHWSKYNSPFFEDCTLTEDQFIHKNIMYLLLFAIEIVGDFVILFLSWILHGRSNMYSLGSYKLLSNPRTLFLYSVFMLHLMSDIYFAMLFVPEKVEHFIWR